ncbi:MAG: AlpA family phage regulatory protein [Hydrogenovibrio crunogenus]|uniref:Uncharacterized protein n=1 Tax=Hydrogenovibrio crunogenus TaxID=39765 RepID=A0A4P7NYE8_9GAMM|nr:AlpA family phage regulatory protein [Hydrogenovibrio crunogenus]MBD3611568.1 AlpA family phage regulatory protein [Hydrogenovibrio crunogenus]QBZ82793.1 hypothetical protein GHNINEIG_00829 [Hydrogenovibrio crunogenus]
MNKDLNLPKMVATLPDEDLRNLIAVIITEFFEIYKPQQKTDNLQQKVLLPKEVQQILGYSRAQIDLLSQKDPGFPIVIRLDNGCTGYLESEINLYIEREGKTIH